jgi:hypothetical protein
LNGVCTLVCGKNEIVENGKCVCSPKTILINKVFQECPINSSPNKNKTLCNCNDGFRWETQPLQIVGCYVQLMVKWLEQNNTLPVVGHVIKW